MSTDTTTLGVKFRRRWRGYDPSQVNEFLRQTAKDRQRLEEGLAQLETCFAGQADLRRREIDRLTNLRIEVASCLESSLGALRTATQLLSEGSLPSAPQPQPSKTSQRAEPSKLRATALRFRWARPGWMAGGRFRAFATSVFLLTLIPATLFYRSSGSRPVSRPSVREIRHDTAARPPLAAHPNLTPTETVAGSMPAPIAEGLVLTLTASRQCWIRSFIDGGQPLERLLKASETIMLRANDEAILRVGDASALSLLINNKPAKPLGTSGQVVTAHITRSNYPSLLAQIASP